MTTQQLVPKDTAELHEVHEWRNATGVLDGSRLDEAPVRVVAGFSGASLILVRGMSQHFGRWKIDPSQLLPPFDPRLMTARAGLFVQVLKLAEAPGRMRLLRRDRERTRPLRLRDSDPPRAQRPSLHLDRVHQYPKRKPRNGLGADRSFLQLLYLPQLLALVSASPRPL